MFLDYYKMKEQPFGVTPDPRFLYLGESHREALASLYYGIESDLGFVALIAEPGLGKTTLTFQLLEKLSSASRSVFLFQTQCNSKELFQYLLNGLGIETEGMELVSMHNRLNQILCREMLAGRRFILVIDEAQNLDPQVLETIRLLSNFETSRGKMLQILLVGQRQLARKLATPELEQLQQRISVFARLEPFGSEETARYIAHRLQISGYEGKPLFAPDALRIIAEQSQGVPRKINRLCLSALSLCCAMGRDQVDARMVEEVIADCDLQSLQRPSAARIVAPVPDTSTPNISLPAKSPAIQPAPVTPRPAPAPAAWSRPALSAPLTAGASLSSNPANLESTLGGWVVATICLAAFLAIGIGSYILSPSRSNPISEVSPGPWKFVQSAAAAIHSFPAAKSNTATFSSVTDAQAAEIPDSKPVPYSLANDDAEVNTVVVRRGDTLRQIILRTAGEYNNRTIEQVRTLNPDIADPDQLEVGQTIRLPMVPAPAASAIADDGSSSTRKNSETSHHE